MPPSFPRKIRQPPPVTGQDRWASLWKRLGVLRAQLQERDRVAREIDAGFRREIQPREHRLTDAVIALSDVLVERYRSCTLASPDVCLLGLWISDNLDLLIDHPFADAARVAGLRQRWAATLAPDGDAIPGRLDNTRAELARLLESSEPSGPAPPHHADQAEEPCDRPAEDAASAHARQVGGSDLPAMLLGTADVSSGADAVQQLIARLFRPLAQALHPDREPDEARRQHKQELMSQALKARKTRDLDTLLALHVRHLGESLPGVDRATLEGALERQLEGTRRALARSRLAADPLKRRILERYDAPDPASRTRLVERHAALLEQEGTRVREILRSLDEPDGLKHALDRRREQALDRLAIDELTGLSG